ncbi:MAG: DUF3280 domain-containing protein [Acetobacteraceae bacterium]
MAAAGLPFVLGAAAPPPGTNVAVFPFQLDNTSLQSAQPAEQARLKAITTQLRAALAKQGLAPVALGDAAAKANAQNITACGDCDLALAKQLGATLSAIGWVQKVSLLILNINVEIRDVATGRIVAGGSADIRSDTDESWKRGLAFLVQNTLLPELAK